MTARTTPTNFLFILSPYLMVSGFLPRKYRTATTSRTTIIVSSASMINCAASRPNNVKVNVKVSEWFVPWGVVGSWDVDDEESEDVECGVIGDVGVVGV